MDGKESAGNVGNPGQSHMEDLLEKGMRFTHKYSCEEFLEQRSLAGYSQWGIHKQSDMTEAANTYYLLDYNSCLIPKLNSSLEAGFSGCKRLWHI